MDRKLATIFASDVVGFSKMMGTDEVNTLKILKERRKVIDKIIDDHDGIIFGSAGDSVIAEFASPIKAAQAAVDTQLKMKTMNHGLEDSETMIFRVGINIGDVMITENNLFGDAVNIAARLEAAAKPSGICVSQTVFDMINRKIMVSFEDAGQLDLKNIEFPIKAFHVLENKGTPRFTQDSDKIQKEVKEVEPGSVAVMMFKNLSNDEEQEYFCEGFCEDLLSMLSRFNKLVVISSHASFAYRNKSKDFPEIGKELGVKYVINGSVRRLGKKMRINAQLVSTENKKSLWTNNYDLSIDEVFDVQDQIAEQIVSTIVGRVESDALETIKSKRPENMGAYELVLKGLDYARKGNVIKENTENAVKFFEKAIDLDPNYARAHAWRACSLGNLSDWETKPDSVLFKSAIASAYKALELDSNDPEAHRVMGSIKFFFEKDIELGIYHLEKAKDLCPSDVYIISRYALVLIYTGDIESALKELNRATRLDPFSHDILYLEEGMCYFWLENYEKAIESFRKVKLMQQNLFYLSACYFKLGKSDKAIECLKEAEVVSGSDVESFIKSLPYTKPKMIDFFNSCFLN